MKLLFVGDSLIDYFDWQGAFPGHKVWRYGVPGETVQGLLNRTENIITQAEPPDYILFMTGTNNLAMEDFGFIPLYEKIIDRFSTVLPTAKIIITSLLPIRIPWIADSAVPRMNQHLEDLCLQTDSFFLNIFPAFFMKSGLQRRELFMEDGVHLSTQGYILWTDALADHLDLE
jgi:lysophospholipase L1-like esterase